MQRKRRGFTLIELSIVLVIIGLLLAAVIKGQDLIKSAEIKKFYNNAINEMKLKYTTFLDITGKVLGSPLIIKSNDDNVTIDELVGQCTDVNSTNNSCLHQSDIYANLGTSNQSDLVFKSMAYYLKNNTNEDYVTFTELLQQVGLTEVKSDSSQYSNVFYITSELGKTGVAVVLGADIARKDANISVLKKDGNTVNHTGVGDGKGNFLLLINLPYDIAVAIDKIVDGNADGLRGRMICVNEYDAPIPYDSISKISDDNLQDSATLKRVISDKYRDLDDDVTDICTGIFHWNNDKKKYVTALIKLD
jgi:prepilin-type N-terminal cleavage/methylation domain-containing protein